MLHMKFLCELQIQTHPPHAQSLTAKGSNDVHNHLLREIASYKGLWVDAASSHSSHCLMLFVHLFKRSEFSDVKLFHCSHLAQNNPDERLLWHSSISSVYFLRRCLAKYFSIMKNSHATIASTIQTCSKPNLLPEVLVDKQEYNKSVNCVQLCVHFRWIWTWTEAHTFLWEGWPSCFRLLYKKQENLP